MTSPEKSSQQALEQLKTLFLDKPHLINIVSLGDCQSEKMLSYLRENSELYSTQVKLYATGRTSSGKSSLANSFLNLDLLKSTGRQDCTKELQIVELLSKLVYFDTKQYAIQERSNRYLQNTIEIATRVALQKVDYQIGEEDIVKLAAKAISMYGLLTFNNNPAENTKVLEENTEVLTEEAGKIKDERATDIITQEVKYREEEGFDWESETEEKTWEEDQYFPVTNTREGWEIDLVFIKVGKTPETTTTLEKRTIRRTQSINVIKKVPNGKTIKVVDDIVNEKIETEYSKGGYEAIKFLLGIALGIEAQYKDKSEAATEKEHDVKLKEKLKNAIEKAQASIESKLEPIQEQISQLVKDEQEDSIIELLLEKLIAQSIDQSLEKQKKAERYKQHLLSRKNKLKLLTEEEKTKLQHDWKMVEEIIDENRDRKLFQHQ